MRIVPLTLLAFVFSLVPYFFIFNKIKFLQFLLLVDNKIQFEIRDGVISRHIGPDFEMDIGLLAQVKYCIGVELHFLIWNNFCINKWTFVRFVSSILDIKSLVFRIVSYQAVLSWNRCIIFKRKIRLLSISADQKPIPIFLNQVLWA